LEGDVELIHDLLDKPVIDRNGRPMGRVDGIVVEVPADGAPYVAAIEIGPAVLAHRVLPVLGRWVAGLEVAFGIAEGRPLRIPFADILGIADHVKVDRAVGETSAATVERAMRSIVSRLPGGL
jgi:hypothetical protein